MKLLFTIILCGVGLHAWAQQRPQLSQYMQNNYLINPAVAGVESYADLRTGVRQQWSGIEGAPASMYVSLQASLNKDDRNVKPLTFRRGNKEMGRRSNVNKNNRFHVNPHHGIGAILQTDKAGLLRSSSFNVSYAYHLPLSSTINLSGGVYTGLMQHNISQRDMVLQTTGDPYVSSDAFNVLKLDLGLGLWLYGSDFYLGLSGAQLVRSSTDVYHPDSGPRGQLQPHYFATGGYRFHVSETVNITPSLMYKIAESGQNAIDVNAKVLCFERVWGGLSYRHEEAFAAMVGIFVNHFVDISYSYDVSTSDINKAYANSHEIVLGLKLNNPSRVICPQWIW